MSVVKGWRCLPTPVPPLVVDGPAILGIGVLATVVRRWTFRRMRRQPSAVAGPATWGIGELAITAREYRYLKMPQPLTEEDGPVTSATSESGPDAKMMTAAEKGEQRRIIAIMTTRQRSEPIRLDGYEFTLSDVERRCEVYLYSRPYGELECSGNTRVLARRCETYIHSWPDGEVDCRGSELTIVERRCSVYMYSSQYGEISC